MVFLQWCHIELEPSKSISKPPIQVSARPPIQLSADTPESQISLQTYVIPVQAVDSFGSSRSLASNQVLKTSPAAPNIIFWLSNINTFSNPWPGISVTFRCYVLLMLDSRLGSRIWTFLTMTARRQCTPQVVSFCAGQLAVSSRLLTPYRLQAGGTHVFLLHLEANSEPHSIFSELLWLWRCVRNRNYNWWWYLS